MKTLKIDKPLIIKKTRHTALEEDKAAKARLVQSQIKRRSPISQIVKYTLLSLLTITGLVLLNLIVDIPSRILNHFYANNVQREGYLAITTKYRPAQITINKQDLGTTPLKPVPILPGNYIVTLKAPGILKSKEYTLEIPISVSPHITTVIQANVGPTFRTSSYVMLTTTNSPKPALVITTTPQDVKVYIDDNIAGSTPLNIIDVPIGHKTIRLEKSGYAPTEIEVDIKPNTTVFIDAKLYTRIIKIN